MGQISRVCPDHVRPIDTGTPRGVALQQESFYNPDIGNKHLITNSEAPYDGIYEIGRFLIPLREYGN